jgi:hypothetical protein
MAVKVHDYDYSNAVMRCENSWCRNHVERKYQPFCSSCWRSAVRRGSFVSRNGLRYAYGGRRWFCLDELS